MAQPPAALAAGAPWLRLTESTPAAEALAEALAESSRCESTAMMMMMQVGIHVFGIMMTVHVHCTRHAVLLPTLCTPRRIPNPGHPFMHSVFSCLLLRARRQCMSSSFPSVAPWGDGFA
jgi:hypothetical protein